MSIEILRLKEELDTGWPWPLDAVQNWFEDLWNWVSEAAYGAVNNLINLIPGWVRDWFGNVWIAAHKIGYEALYLVDEWTSGIPEPIRSIVKFFLLPAALSKKVYEDVLHPRLNWLWSQIEPALESAKEKIVTAFDGAFSTAAETFKKALEGLGEILKPAVKFLYDLFKPLIDPIAGAITGIRDFLFKTIPEAWNNFWSEVKERWDGFIKTIEDFKTKVGKLIDDIYTFFTKTLPEWGAKIIDWLKEKISPFVEMIAGLVKPIADKVYTLYRDFINSTTAGLTESIKPGSPEKEVLEQVKKLVEEMKKRVDKLAEQARKGSPVTQAVIFEITNITLNVMAGSEIAEIAGMAADQAHPLKNIGIREKIVKFIEKLGIPQLTVGVLMGWASYGALPLIRRWWRKQFRPELPDVTEIKTWTLRGLMKVEESKELLAEHGYSDQFIEYMIKSWEVIPPISDLITFVVREVISPEDFYGWAAKQGLTEYWAKNYWEAHWVLPSFDNLREAFWRGIISEEEYKKYIVWHDYKPEPRPGISKSDQAIMAELSYKLPGRIDARWMVRWGLISKEDLKALTKAEGMHPKWIDKVTEAEYLNQLLEERTRVKSEYTSSYAKGLISREKLEEKLRSVRFIDEEIQYLLDAADEARRRELVEMALKTLTERWKRGKITRADFEDSARTLGLEDEYIKRYADKVEEGFREYERVDLTKDERKSIASFLMNKYKRGYMTEEELQRRLEALELTQDEVDLRMRLAAEEYDYELKEMLKESYIAAYRKDQIDEEKLRELLTSLGLRTDYIETTIKAESYRKRVQRVEVETITDKIAKLDYQEKQQLLYIQDLTTDLQAKERIYTATIDLWKERINRLQEQIQLTVDPAKRAKLEAQLRQMQIQADLAITKAEAAYIDAKEKLESAQAKLDEIRREKEVLRRALGVT